MTKKTPVEFYFTNGSGWQYLCSDIFKEGHPIVRTRLLKRGLWDTVRLLGYWGRSTGGDCLDVGVGLFGVLAVSLRNHALLCAKQTCFQN